METNGKHLHYIVWAFDEYDPDTGHCRNNTTLDLIAQTVQEAVLRAQEIFPGKLYRINSIIEHFDGACQK